MFLATTSIQVALFAELKCSRRPKVRNCPQQSDLSVLHNQQMNTEAFCLITQCLPLSREKKSLYKKVDGCFVTGAARAEWGVNLTKSLNAASTRVRFVADRGCNRPILQASHSLDIKASLAVFVLLVIR